MKKLFTWLLFILSALTTGNLWAQKEDASSPMVFGVEQDVLPYLTGGYYAGVFAAKGHIRVRALMAQVRKPGIIVPDGFTDNWVTAYALVGDYFLRDDMSGLWISSGIVHWASTIRAENADPRTAYANWLLNGSMGYNVRLGKNIYLSPWAGLHLRISGDKTVSVAGKSFDTALLNPEASLKVGYVF